MKKSTKNNLITGLVLLLSVGAVGAVAGLTKGFTDWNVKSTTEDSHYGSIEITPELIKKDSNGNVLSKQTFTFGDYSIDLFAGSKYFKTTSDSIKVLDIDATTSSTRKSDLDNRVYIFSGYQFVGKYIRVTFDVKNCTYDGWANFNAVGDSNFSKLGGYDFNTSDNNFISNPGKHVIYTKEKNTGSYLFLDQFAISPYDRHASIEFNSIKLEVSDNPFYVIDKLVTIDLNPEFFATNFSGVGCQTYSLSEKYGVNMSLYYSSSSFTSLNEYPNYIDKIHFGKTNSIYMSSPVQYMRLSATVSEIPSTYDSTQYSKYLGENIAVGENVVITNMSYLYYLNQLDYSHIKIELSPTPFEAAKKAVKSSVASMETNEIKLIDSVEDDGTYWGPLH